MSVSNESTENPDLFRGLGVEIRLPNKESFLKVRETLTRIGIPSRKEKKLYQSCHILHKRGRYAIMHFKEMFILDNLNDELPEEDLIRRNTIASLLHEWGLVEIVNPSQIESTEKSMNSIQVLPFREKDEWELIKKYRIGNN